VTWLVDDGNAFRLVEGTNDVAFGSNKEVTKRTVEDNFIVESSADCYYNLDRTRHNRPLRDMIESLNQIL
jgi:hypothetical protein